MSELLTQLKSWRSERPDEWKMDEFLRLAEEQNKRIAELERENKDLDESLTLAYMQGYSDGKAKLKEHKDNE